MENFFQNDNNSRPNSPKNSAEFQANLIYREEILPEINILAEYVEGFNQYLRSNANAKQALLNLRTTKANLSGNSSSSDNPEFTIISTISNNEYRQELTDLIDYIGVCQTLLMLPHGYTTGDFERESTEYVKNMLLRELDNHGTDVSMRSIIAFFDDFKGSNTENDNTIQNYLRELNVKYNSLKDLISTLNNL